GSFQGRGRFGNELQVLQRGGVIRFDGEHLLELSSSLTKLALPRQGNAKAQARFHQTRVELQGRVKLLRRGGIFPFPGKFYSIAQMPAGEIGVQGDRPREMLLRLRKSCFSV